MADACCGVREHPEQRETDSSLRVSHSLLSRAQSVYGVHARAVSAASPCARAARWGPPLAPSTHSLAQLCAPTPGPRRTCDGRARALLGSYRALARCTPRGYQWRGGARRHALSPLPKHTHCRSRREARRAVCTHSRLQNHCRAACRTTEIALHCVLSRWGDMVRMGSRTPGPPRHRLGPPGTPGTLVSGPGPPL